MEHSVLSEVDDVVESLFRSYQKVGSLQHIGGPQLPSQPRTIEIWQAVRSILFPGYFERRPIDKSDLPDLTRERVAWVRRSLSGEIRKSLCYNCTTQGECSQQEIDQCKQKAYAITDSLLKNLPEIRAKLHLDAKAALDGDPAAKSEAEVIVAYPGVAAVAVNRIAHFLYEQDVPLLPRIMSEYIHHQTGVDIHPGASIGESFFIDHATGVVIGETTSIGDCVKIYQGVTLGALSVKKSSARTKRHPTIEDNVTVYAGATILGGKTVIGHDSVIGGGVWLVESVPPLSRVYNSHVLHQPVVESPGNGKS